LALLLAAPVAARAETTEAAEVDGDATAVEGVADQEIGGRLGLRMGGRTTPGGFALGGVYLYRITGSLWSDSSMTFTLGGGGAECFRDRQDLVVCDHGQLDGIAGGVHSGVRWVQPGKQGFVPYVRATLGVELVNYGDDNVNGVAIPVVVGGGVRARVAERISVGGGADLHVGLGRLSKEIGTEPHVAMSVMLGVDFAL
jgi:hypothetical protein